MTEQIKKINPARETREKKRRNAITRLTGIYNFSRGLPSFPAVFRIFSCKTNLINRACARVVGTNECIELSRKINRTGRELNNRTIQSVPIGEEEETTWFLKISFSFESVDYSCKRELERDLLESYAQRYSPIETSPARKKRIASRSSQNTKTLGVSVNCQGYHHCGVVIMMRDIKKKEDNALFRTEKNVCRALVTSE